MNPAALSIAEQGRRLRQGTLSPVDLVDASLERIASADARLHCMTQVFADRARERAKQLTAAPVAGPLWGIPYVVKDVLATQEGETRCGSRLLEQYRSPFDATCVQRLEAAGAILVGKTNMDEFAMGSSTENSAFGPTHNPWNPDHVPGGSSGGSAAAVAAGYVPFALGTDTGGSIRQPAAFCGVVGMKPTYGRVSRFGLVAFASSLDQIGPFTQSVHDTALVLDAIAGHDARDATSLVAPPPALAFALDKAPTGLRVGVPRAFVEHGLEPAAAADFARTLQRLQDASATIVDVELPRADASIACYYVVATAEASANLARFDGVRYTRRARDARDVASMFERSRTEGFGAEVKRRILLGTYVLSSGYYDAYYLRAQKVRTLIRQDFDTAFERCDVIAMPTTPGPAFRFGDRTEDPLQMYLSDIFTVPANLAGLPAISLPSGMAGDLPLGVQLYGPAGGELRLLQAAHMLEARLEFAPWRERA